MEIIRKLVKTDGRVLEMQNATLCLTVGILFIFDWALDGNMYERNPATYRYMAWTPTVTWGVLYTVLGLVHLWTIRATAQIESKRYTLARWLRKHVLLAKFTAWVFLGACVLRGDIYAASGWFYFIFALVAVRAFFRLQILKENPNDGTLSNG